VPVEMYAGVLGMVLLVPCWEIFSH